MTDNTPAGQGAGITPPVRPPGPRRGRWLALILLIVIPTCDFMFPVSRRNQ